MRTLGQAERARLNAILDRDVYSGVDRRTITEGRISRLRAAEANGDQEAERILTWLAEEGYYDAMRERYGVLNRSIVIEPSTGRRYDLSASASVPKRANNGAKTGARQLTLWKRLSQEEWQEWSATQRAIGAGWDVKRRTMDKVDEAWAKHAGRAKTTEEACRLAGLDPDVVDLDLAV